MNALVRKEIRLLLPSFTIGLMAVCSIWLIPDKSRLATDLEWSLGMLAFLVSPGLLVLMTMTSFGRELSAGTFSFMLAQPVPRSRVWWTKTLMLAATTAILWTVWWLALSSHRSYLVIPREDRIDALLTALIFTIVVYSGGLWTTVLFRQLAPAFWFTLLTPAAMALVIVGVLGKDSDEGNPILKLTLVIALSFYSVAGFAVSHWLFLRAQDTHWTGGEISVPNVHGLAWRFPRHGERRQRRPGAALWLKELQLHQSQFLLAGILALFQLAVIALRTWGGDFKNYPALEFVLEHFWVLWMAMPLMVGCAAVAEERRLSTLEGQLCLPSRRRTQFGIKFVTALLLSLALGFVAPLLMEGARILPEFADSSSNAASNYAFITPGGTKIPIGHIVEAIRAILPFLTLAGIAVLVALPSFYASTLSRNAMQALAPALLGVLVTSFLLMAASAPEELIRHRLWRGGLVYFIGLPVMAVVLARLTYWNFKRVLVGWPVWRRNLLVVLAALGGVTAVTSLTYHRAWEHFLTLEPRHGPPRLDRSQLIALRNDAYHVAIEFADGRSWSSRVRLSVPDWIAMVSGDWTLAEMPGSAGYLDGTNWASVARTFRDVVGVRKDGSLWVSEQPEPLATTGWPALSPNPALIRLGEDSDWKTATGHGSQVFLLKTNGSLWRLGTNRMAWKNWPGFRAFTPERLGAGTNWASISKLELGRLAFRKTDGRAWHYPAQKPPSPEDPDSLRLDEATALERAYYLDDQRAAAWVWTSTSPPRNLRLGIGDDGALRVVAYWGFVRQVGGSQQNWDFIPQNIPLGAETNWLALANNRHDVVALKSDGTLRKLGFRTDPIMDPDGFTATPLSRHSDWVALTESMDGILALAADGSLWFWAMEGRHFYPSGFTLQPMLAASRRPQFVGNVFPRPAP